MLCCLPILFSAAAAWYQRYPTYEMAFIDVPNFPIQKYIRPSSQFLNFTDIDGASGVCILTNLTKSKPRRLSMEDYIDEQDYANVFADLYNDISINMTMHGGRFTFNPATGFRYTINDALTIFGVPSKLYNHSNQSPAYPPIVSTVLDDSQFMDLRTSHSATHPADDIINVTDLERIIRGYILYPRLRAEIYATRDTEKIASFNKEYSFIDTSVYNDYPQIERELVLLLPVEDKDLLHPSDNPPTLLDRIVKHSNRHLPRLLFHTQYVNEALSNSSSIYQKAKEVVDYSLIRRAYLGELVEGHCSLNKLAPNTMAYTDVYAICLPSAPHCTLLSLRTKDDGCGHDIILGCERLCRIKPLAESFYDAFSVFKIHCLRDDEYLIHSNDTSA